MKTSLNLIAIVLAGALSNTILRLYGPLQPWFDRTWKPGEFEPVK